MIRSREQLLVAQFPISIYTKSHAGNSDIHSDTSIKIIMTILCGHAQWPTYGILSIMTVLLGYAQKPVSYGILDSLTLVSSTNPHTNYELINIRYQRC